MVKAFSFFVIAFALLLAIPICLGVAGGIFGLAVGLLGGIVGVFFGLIGAVIGCIAWIIKGFFHLLFGWHFSVGFHPFHFNGYAVAAIIILLFVVASKRRK